MEPGTHDAPVPANLPDMTRVFVTGASGFIGGALARRLIEGGDEVVGLARSDAAAQKVAEHGATVARGDLLDEESIAEGMDGCELAFHVAGMNSHCPSDPDMMLRVNVGGAEATVRAAARAGVGRIVYTSSAASVGEPAGTVGTEDCAHRGSYLSVYDRSKHEGEQAVFAAAADTGVEAVAVNPSSVQGPPRASGNGGIIIAYLNGKLPLFVDTHVSVVDVEDCVEGHVLAAERGESGRRYLLNGATLPALEALEIVSELSGVRDRVRMVPRPVARTAVAIAEAAYRMRGKTPSVCRARVRTILHGHRYDGSLATRELGLEYTPVEDTFARTIDWAVSEGLVTRPLARATLDA
jgi:dihydroflavonol-4-reductase